MATCVRWTYDSVLLPVVNVHKYFGVLFSTKLSFTASCYDLTSKAKNAGLCIMQKLRILNNNSFELFLKLFDFQVQPIALYGAELWGLEITALQSTFICAEKVFRSGDANAK